MPSQSNRKLRYAGSRLKPALQTGGRERQTDNGIFFFIKRETYMSRSETPAYLVYPIDCISEFRKLTPLGKTG
jgi:hypothetical protein